MTQGRAPFTVPLDHIDRDDLRATLRRTGDPWAEPTGFPGKDIVDDALYGGRVFITHHTGREDDAVSRRSVWFARLVVRNSTGSSLRNIIIGPVFASLPQAQAFARMLGTFCVDGFVPAEMNARDATRLASAVVTAMTTP